MDTHFYLNEFQKVADQIDKKLLTRKHLEVAVGLYEDSVFLKLYKRSWANNFQDPLTSESRIFFSIWINDKTLNQQKVFYNIHALKLRLLKDYLIESRKFADAFRLSFKKFEHKWQNVSVKFGPLTLMQGWIEIDLKNFNENILLLAKNFIEIEYIIDDNLANFK
jgi:hypothetical protein